MLEAYIEEQSAFLVDSVYLEADDDDESTNKKDNTNDQGIFKAIFTAIKNMFNKLISTVQYIFTGRSADTALSDPNKRVKLKYNPMQVSNDGVREIHENCEWLQKFASVTGIDVDTAGKIADTGATVVGVAGSFFGLKQIWGWINGLTKNAEKANKEIEDTEKALEQAYTRLDGGKRKTIKEKLSALKKIAAEKVSGPFQEVLKAVQDGCKKHIKYGIFDKDTPQHIITKWSNTPDDKYLDKNIVDAMKIPEKYAELKPYIKTEKDETTGKKRMGLKRFDHNEEEAQKNFDAFVAKVNSSPTSIRKGEFLDFFTDLYKLRQIKDWTEALDKKEAEKSGTPKEGEQPAQQGQA